MTIQFPFFFFLFEIFFEKLILISYRTTVKMPLVFHVKENIPGAFIGQVLPYNGTNSTRNIRFLIANHQDVPNIDITSEGTLFTPTGLDRESRENYSITVIAENVRGVGIFQVKFQPIQKKKKSKNV